MKRILAILLVCLFALTAVACNNGEGEDSSAAFTASSQAGGDKSEAAESSAADKSEADTSEDTSDEESKEESGETSGEESGETSDDSSEGGDNVYKPTFLTQFVSWKNHFANGGIVGVRNTDATSLKLSKMNTSDVLASDIAVFTSVYGSTIASDTQDYAEFAVVVFEYDHSVFSYVKKSFKGVGEADAATAIPEDGYVVAIHKDYTDKINAIEAVDNTTAFYPHGIIVNNGLNSTISKVTSAPTADGIVNASEYGGKVLWEIKPDNELINYAQFEVNNYYATAKVYLAYDETNLYLGVVVDSPNHYNVLTQSSAGDMYNYECIQVNVSSKPASSSYMEENWDNVTNPNAANGNYVRQMGYAVNDNGETLICRWIGGATDKHTAVCTRDDAAGKTYYEVVIPWSDCGATDEPIKVEKGTTFGFSLSVNSGSETSQFKNITLRDGGGIIGINDWTKIPEITLG